MRTHEGQSRGFGFCVFHSPSVFRAVLNTRNHMIDNRRVSTTASGFILFIIHFYKFIFST